MEKQKLIDIAKRIIGITPKAIATLNIVEKENKIFCELHWNIDSKTDVLYFTIVLPYTKRNKEIANAYKKAVADKKLYTNLQIIKNEDGTQHVRYDSPARRVNLEETLIKLKYLES